MKQNKNQHFADDPCDWAAQRPAYSDLVNQLSRTLLAANRYLNKLLCEQDLHGIVTSHGEILMLLHRESEITMKVLAERIGKDPSTVTSLVRKLIDAGYVEKVINPADRRSTSVRLTAAGRAIESSICTVSDKLIGVAESALTCEELMHLKQHLEALQRSYEEAYGKTNESTR